MNDSKLRLVLEIGCFIVLSILLGILSVHLMYAVFLFLFGVCFGVVVVAVLQIFVLKYFIHEDALFGALCTVCGLLFGMASIVFPSLILVISSAFTGATGTTASLYIISGRSPYIVPMSNGEFFRSVSSGTKTMAMFLILLALCGMISQSVLLLRHKKKQRRTEEQQPLLGSAHSQSEQNGTDASIP
eukprot:CAMPEP_0182443028 /NCGR_PEP_ID=MMETSP1172-20130603/1873_1 /TAXON_ID=708627 /ORGANISM="Timspurckia oligopyrenoides, Strain CCMP3278" /LENGTH=186 /DNA_ID=CAMNT_0024638177 /DNA_START=510 /DNA_END=1070 /DNA_ORIENTATION=-